jgi:hypothetical protein
MELFVRVLETLNGASLHINYVVKKSSMFFAIAPKNPKWSSLLGFWKT